MTHFTAIITLLQWSRTKPAIFLRYACIKIYKTLLKEIKDTINCKDIFCVHGSEDLALRWQYSPKLSYRFNVIPIRILANFFVKTNKLIQKFIWNCKGPRIAKTTLKKKNKVGGLTYPNFKTYYKTTSIRTDI